MRLTHVIYFSPKIRGPKVGVRIVDQGELNSARYGKQLLGTYSFLNRDIYFPFALFMSNSVGPELFAEVISRIKVAAEHCNSKNIQCGTIDCEFGQEFEP